MIRFLGGLAIGILAASIFWYADTDDKVRSVFIGVTAGIMATMVMSILFLYSCKSPQNENKGDWWQTGNKPPWEQDD